MDALEDKLINMPSFLYALASIIKELDQVSCSLVESHFVRIQNHLWKNYHLLRALRHNGHLKFPDAAKHTHIHTHTHH